MADSKKYLFNLPKGSRPTYAPINEHWYPGVRDVWDGSTSSRIFDSILGIKTVVIHATAGVSSSGAMSVMNANKASWHWLVPDEDEAAHAKFVWACAPEARAAWHVRNAVSHPAVNSGANKVNHWSLGIEIVNSQKRDIIDPFSDWQVQVTADIVRYCWAKYPNLTQVVSHAMLDPTRRRDPGNHFPWETFRQLVLKPSAVVEEPEVVTLTTPLNKLKTMAKLDTCCY